MSDLRPKCTKFYFGWGSVPDPAEGAYSTPDPLVGFNGPTSKGGEGMERRRCERRGKGSRGDMGKEGREGLMGKGGREEGGKGQRGGGREEQEERSGK